MTINQPFQFYTYFSISYIYETAARKVFSQCKVRSYCISDQYHPVTSQLTQSSSQSQLVATKPFLLLPTFQTCLLSLPSLFTMLQLHHLCCCSKKKQLQGFYTQSFFYLECSSPNSLSIPSPLSSCHFLPDPGLRNIHTSQVFSPFPALLYHSFFLCFGGFFC